MSTPTIEGPDEARSGASLRYATRYEPARRDACLAWKDHQGLDQPTALAAGAESHRSFALLLDISHTGASVALDMVPAPDRCVWLRLEGESQTEWTEADVVGITTTARGPHLVRLAFRGPCSFETLRTAVCG